MKIELKKGARYSLRRERDGAGDSGPMLVPVYWKEVTQDDGTKDYEMEFGERGTIQVGAAVRVGSITARSYQYQDWWQTTAITEILERNEDDTYIKFKTGNSVYELKVF